MNNNYLAAALAIAVFVASCGGLALIGNYITRRQEDCSVENAAPPAKPGSEIDAASVVILGLYALAVILLVAGVAVLAGLGWALLSGSASSLASAALLRKGMTNG